MILHVSTLQKDWGRLKMRLNIFCSFFPILQRLWHIHRCSRKAGCIHDQWGLLVQKPHGKCVWSARIPFFGHKKNASHDRDLQVMSQLLGSDRPVRSSILYLLALGYSQKIDPREWREKPLLIWYDAGRNRWEQHLDWCWRLLMLVVLVSSLGMNQNLWNTFT